MQTIGTCSLCGGAVQVPMHWGGSTPPVPTCASCGATQRTPYGPVIEMAPNKPYQFDRYGAKVYRSYSDYIDD